MSDDEIIVDKDGKFSGVSRDGTTVDKNGDYSGATDRNLLFEAGFKRHKDSIVDEKRAYNSSTPPFHNINSNTLGFGNYKRVYSHSYIEDQLVFYTMNDNWETRYFAVHDETDLELNRKTIGWNDVINL